jgi:histidyl-tRNA synthetase
MAGGALPGFRDFYPDEFAHRAHITRAWRDVARRYAFVEYDGPPLEPLELYTKKSGDEIVRQLYAFEDKGGRQVALRPEMTPTFARMVGARANALRKPVRWFSIPQLFRYERAQRGRLREHFQLNVDIVGEPGEVADAELLGVAVDIMRALGLGPGDVRARVSDRRLLNAILHLTVDEPQTEVVYAVLDKVGRQPEDVSRAKLAAAGVAEGTIDELIGMTRADGLARVRAVHGKDRGVAERLERLDAYLAHVNALGLSEWVDVDLSIVRGLAYYTGIVFELFDARGELRAICGGGRYDNLLKDLGGVDLPALGFGMGDVVLGELLRQRGLLPAGAAGGADLYVIGGPGAVTAGIDGALRLASALRAAGFAVDHAMSASRYASAGRNQFEAARKSGAVAAIYLDEGGRVSAKGLAGKLGDAPVFSADASELMRGGEPMDLLRAFIGGLRPPPRG